ncbi:MAG: hypothetical protein K0U66_07295 [Gammaproteobacteria bacterium]|nr:hypothetical protein [Gammaproteobacteria bacterium]
MDKNASLPNFLTNEIGKLNENQLILLNQIVVERLNLISQAHSLSALARFHAGQKVKFNRNGRIENATIIRLNKKTISILTDSQEKWKVSPHFLS